MNSEDFLLGVEIVGIGVSIAYIRAIFVAQMQRRQRTAARRRPSSRDRGLCAALLCVAGLMGCQRHGGLSCSLDTCATSNTLGGTINGLVGSGLAVGDTSGSPYLFNGPPANGTKALFGLIDFNTSYNVSVQAQPTNPSQTCVVANGAGTTAGSYGAPTNISNITITCTTNPPRFIYVVNGGSNDVSAYTVDATSGALTPVAGSPFATGNLPVAVTVDPAGTHAYIADQTDATLSAFSIDRATGALTPIGGSPFASGPSPTSVAIDPSNSYVYVTSGHAGTVAAYSVEANGALAPVTGSPFVTGNAPSSVAVDPLNRFVYVANEADGTISDFSIGAAGTLTAVSGSPFSAGMSPRSVAVDPSGQFVYVANVTANTLFGSNLYNNDVGTPATLRGSPYATGTHPVAVAMDPLDKYVYVANQGSNDISAYELGADGSLSVVVDSPFPGGSEPTAVAIDPTGRFVFVANPGAGSGAGSVSVYAIAAAGALSAVKGSPYPAGTRPTAIAISD